MNIGIIIQFIGLGMLLINLFQPGFGPMFYIGAIMSIPPWGKCFEERKK